MDGDLVTSQRRTQTERTQQMRERLLDATLDALVEIGYKATTTTDVAQRAGVSPGALGHHFPARSDLLTAAVRYAVTRRQEEFERAATSFDPSGDVIEELVRLLWSMFSSPTHTAFSELWMAARTDAELAKTLVAIDRDLMSTSEAMCEQILATYEVPTENATVALHLVFAVLSGLATARLIPGYEPYPAEEVLEAFTTMARRARAVLDEDPAASVLRKARPNHPRD